MKVPVGISNRHIHLSQQDLDQLFGPGYELKKLKDLKQVGQYAAEETVNIVGPKGRINKVRVLGPVRKATQLEVSRTDSFVLGVEPPVRDSGDIKGSPGITLEGPYGTVAIDEGVIIAFRHIHFSDEEAKEFGVKDKQFVSVEVPGSRSIVFENVLCRVHKDFRLELHIDTDEANAAGLKNNMELEVIVPVDNGDTYSKFKAQEKKLSLVLNCGSSSVKYQLFELPSRKVIDKGMVEEVKRDAYEKAINAIFDKYKQYDISMVSHRVVHGGEDFKESVIITDDVKRKIDALSRFAPLHNPINLLGIELAQKCRPDALHVAVFDTAFHQTMPPVSYLYPLPYEYYEKYGIRKYGFHGTSHRYVVQRAEQLMGTPKEKLRLISCHIGSGASITAVRYGQSIDTSMGMTPLAGVMMGTRSGNIDPGILPYIAEIEKTDTSGAMEILNKESGVLGLSGISSDLRDIEKAAAEGNERADLALQLFAQRLHDFIGLYLARLNGIDGIIFTAGVGENSKLVRQLVCNGLEYAGVILDKEANRNNKGEGFINSPYSPVKIMVIPTNEELVMATDAYRIFLNNTDLVQV
ncbi:acetate/propionate family kinase [Brevibacterium sp. JNUCC-42]|nr:acetate/propionate family kinase [Brevibacterium sp. JNUCC-42]